MRNDTTKRLCGLLAALAFCLGCGSYGETSPLAYEHVKSLYTVCNQKHAEQLERASERIEAARNSQEISAQEAGWLMEIVEIARGGDWQSASQSCREMLEAQVRGKP